MDPIFTKSEYLTTEEFIKAVKNDEVKGIFLGSLSVIMTGKLNVQTFKNYESLGNIWQQARINYPQR